MSILLCILHYRTRQALQQHMRTHTSERPYKCIVCPCTFKTHSAAHRHALVHQPRPKTHGCNQCLKKFTSKQGLVAHSKVHGNEPFVCSLCQKAFKSAGSLAIHNLTHKYPTRLHKCKLCNKAYIFKSLLIRHMEGHEGAQRFTCHICSSKFVWKSGLVAHLKVHRPKRFRCWLCHASFPSDIKLRTHTKKHSNPRPHCCNLCLKKFTYNYLLVKHQKNSHDSRDFVTIKARKNVQKRSQPNEIESEIYAEDFPNSSYRNVQVTENDGRDVTVSVYDGKFTAAGEPTRNSNYISPSIVTNTASAGPALSPVTYNSDDQFNLVTGRVSNREPAVSSYAYNSDDQINLAPGRVGSREPPPSYAASPCGASQSPYLSFDGHNPNSSVTNTFGNDGMGLVGSVYHSLQHASPSMSYMTSGQNPNLIRATDPYLPSSLQPCLSSPHVCSFSPQQTPYGVRNEFALDGNLGVCSPPAYQSPNCIPEMDQYDDY